MQRTTVAKIDVQSSLRNAFIEKSGANYARPIAVIITSISLMPIKGRIMPPNP